MVERIVPVRLLNQLIGIGVIFADLSAELDRVPLLGRSLYRAS